MDFSSDPVDDFLSREREEIGDLINDGEIIAGNNSFSGMSNDDFELINSEIKQADDAMANELADDLSGMSFISSQPTVTSEVKIVPEKIRIWKENTEKMLEEKDRAEQEAREALKVNAQKEMDEWKTKYFEQLEKTKAMNRTAESEYNHSDLNGSTESKNVWESIANLCDFSSKGPKNTKDASRIRQIFLQMKTSPPTKVN